MKAPNIVFVLTDDQGYGDLGCHGNRDILTPAIDAFHARAVRFTQFHAGTTCAPSRAGLLTGLHCNSAGVWHTIGGASLLRSGVQTLPEILKAQGYHTGLFGKWHLGDDYPYRPNDRGFDHAVYHRGGGLTQISDHWGNDYFDDTYLVNGEPRAFKGYCTDVFFDEALQFIEAHREEPFCCFITPNAPHAPLNVESYHLNRYAGTDLPEQRKRFYAMISAIDDNFNQLQDRLRAWGLEDNTILIFMTDNGTAAGCGLDEDQFPTDGFNAGMRGMKGSPFEGGHRVPFFLRWPAGDMEGGHDIDAVTSYTDITPTLLALAGVTVPETMEGESLLPLLKDPKRAASSHWTDRVLITDTQRVPYPIKWRLSCVMQERWRLICGRELYDVQADPGQRNNVAAAHPDEVASLRAAYEEWWTRCSRQFHVDSPVHIGSKQCPEVHLTTMELRNEDGDTVWHQGQVRGGRPCQGWWRIHVEQAGRYHFALRRWPAETNRPICAGVDGTDMNVMSGRFLSPSTLDWYQDGKALDIHGASLRIDDDTHYRDVGDDMPAACFDLALEEGPHTLRAWFSGGNKLASSVVMSPYYIDIKPCPGAS